MMDPERRLNIRFFVGGKRFADRSWWSAVPRVGDEVMLGPEDAKLPYRVKRVVWGVEGPEEERFRVTQCVNVEIAKVREGGKR